MPALLQDAHHLLPLLELLLPLLAALPALGRARADGELRRHPARPGPGFDAAGSFAGGFVGAAPARRTLADVGMEPLPLAEAVAVQDATDVEELLEPLRGLELRLLPRPPRGAPREQVEQRRVPNFHLHLLLGRAVAVANHREHRAELLRRLVLLLRAREPRHVFFAADPSWGSPPSELGFASSVVSSAAVCASAVIL